MTLSSQFLDNFKLRLKSLIGVSLIDIFNEVDTEEISQAGPDMFSLNDIIRTAVGTPGRLRGTGSRETIDLGVVG